MAAVTAPVRPPRPHPSRSRLRWRDIAGWAALLGLLCVWAITLRPTELGGPATYVVVSGDSMEPMLSNGDLVVLRERPAYAVGDVITFPVPDGEPGAGALVIHRVVDTEGSTYVPQGDNREQADDWRPTSEEVRGSLWWHVPRGGHLLGLLLHPPLLAAATGGLTTIWLLLREPTPPARKRNS